MAKVFDIARPKPTYRPPASSTPVIDSSQKSRAGGILKFFPFLDLSFGQRLNFPVLVVLKRGLKQGAIYFVVGLISFLFFISLFWGYQRYESGRRAVLTREQNVAGSQTQQGNQLSIRLLNASGSSEKLKVLTDILEENDLEVRTSGTAARKSEKTIIYYEKDSAEEALSLARILSQFAPALERNDDLVGVDDIVILLGEP